MAGRRPWGRLCRSWCSLPCAAWCHGAPGGSAGCNGALRRPDGRPAPPGTAVQELVPPLNFLRWVECAGRCISHFPERLVTDICSEVAVRQTSSSSRAHLNILTFLIVCAPRRALANADFDGESECSVVVLGSSGQVRYALFNHAVWAGRCFPPRETERASSTVVSWPVCLCLRFGRLTYLHRRVAYTYCMD
jgi:hypothetical protein